MKNYEILYDEYDDDYETKDKGPFTVEEIVNLVDTEVITRDQDIRKLDTEEVVSADYILIFDIEEDENESAVRKTKTSVVKALLGVAMVLSALALIYMIVDGANSGQQVRGRQLIIIGVLGLAGAKILIDNVRWTGSGK